VAHRKLKNQKVVALQTTSKKLYNIVYDPYSVETLEMVGKE